MTVGSKTLPVYGEREPSALPWAELGVEVVVEASGRFTARDKASGHLEAGAQRVVVSAPCKDADATFVIGVNEHTFDPARHRVVSNASCTTNCLVPMIKVHIVPTSTGAARATGLVMQSMKGRLDGTAVRVPVPDGSLVDLVTVLRRDATSAEVKDAFHRAATDGPLAVVLEYSEEPLVSTDILGSQASCTFDADLTMASANLVKTLGWYDNEWGYANRLAELTALVGSSST